MLTVCISGCVVVPGKCFDESDAVGVSTAPAVEGLVPAEQRFD